MQNAIFKSDKYQTVKTYFSDLATPYRYKRLNDGIKHIDKFIVPDFHAASDGHIGLVHDQDYIDFIKSIGNITFLDDDITCVTDKTYEYCSLTLGGVKKSVDMIYSNEINNALSIGCCGHHAFRNRAAGYCVFNSAAFAVKYAESLGLSSIVIDWDVHYGDGTYSIIGDKLFSIHQHPLYPMTGGNKTDRIIPVSAGCGDKEYLEILNSFDSIIHNISPDIIIVSCGFDIMDDDFMSEIKITYDGLEKMCNHVLNLGKPTIFSTEGGYNQDILGKCIGVVTDSICNL